MAANIVPVGGLMWLSNGYYIPVLCVRHGVLHKFQRIKIGFLTFRAKSRPPKINDWYGSMDLLYMGTYCRHSTVGVTT